MKLKRAKAYKKLLHQYELNFGFREPYQVLLDSEILQDAYKFKIDLIARLQKILGAQVKPMITTCDMRHLYLAKPKNETLILQAKEYERRRCNHQDLDEPLSSLECLSSVVDPKGSGTNKHRYVVASNDPDVRAQMRQIPGVPLIYISKSVVLMEPMADATEQLRAREEKSKFKLGLKGQRKPEAVMQKRKRDEEGEGDQSIEHLATEEEKPKKKRKGPKGPNPLSVMKPKKDKAQAKPAAKKARTRPAAEDTAGDSADKAEGGDGAPRKRRRKHKSKADGEGATADGAGDEEPASP
jgi:U3 small nucleolar RNA-associated protein 23